MLDVKRGASGLFAALGVLVVLSVITWHTTGPAVWERPLIALATWHQPPLSRLVILAFEPLPFLVATIWLASKAWAAGRARVAIAGATGSVAALVLTERVLKPLVDRHHPYGGSPVFPSGHVTAAAALAMFAWFVVERRRALLPLIPLLVGWAVVGAGVHYPADVAGGVIVAPALVSAAVMVSGRATRAIAGRAVPTSVPRRPSIRASARAS